VGVAQVVDVEQLRCDRIAPVVPLASLRIHVHPHTATVPAPRCWIPRPGAAHWGVAADLEPLPPGWEPHEGLGPRTDRDGPRPDRDGPRPDRDGPRPDRDGPPPDRDGEGVTAARHRRLSPRGRRLVLAAVVVVAGLAAAAVVAQNVLDRRATRRAVAVLDAYEGGDYLLNVASVSALQQMVPDDQGVVDAGLARQDRAQAAGYGRLVRELERSPFLDGSTRHLVASVRALLRSRVADLDALAAWRLRPAASRGPQPLDPSPASEAASARALGAVARHAGHPAQLPSAPIPSLSVDLTRYSDSATGTLLAVGDSEGVQLVDVDASSSVDVQLTGTTGSVVARAGYVAAVTPSGAAVAKAPAVPAAVTELGLAGQILPAIEPDAVWLLAGGADTATGAPTTTVTEVDGNGRRLAGPTLVPNEGGVKGGVTGDGLVIDGGGGRLAVWDPVTGVQRVVTAVPATLLAASADRLAWQPDDNGVVDVTDLGTGTTTSFALPPGNAILPVTDVAATTCAFAPDGGRLACPVTVLSSATTAGAASQATNAFHLAVIGLGDGSVQVSPGAAGRNNPHPLVWAADGSRLWTIVTTAQGSLLASWAAGTPSARELRFRAAQTLTGLAVVAS
jgi:hypothetical protein